MDLLKVERKVTDWARVNLRLYQNRGKTIREGKIFLSKQGECTDQNLAEIYFK